MLDLKNKNVLLVGASSGIGFELAKQLLKEDCNLSLLARRKELIDGQIKNIPGERRKIISIKCDVTIKDEVKSAVAESIQIFGSIDVLIYNSGVSTPQSIKKFNSTQSEEVFKVNVNGFLSFIAEIVPGMIERSNGLIVGVSSLAEGRGFPRNGVYSASKAAISILLESLRIELKKYGINVITVKPGFVKTPMTDKNNFKMPFLMSSEKAAKIITAGIKKEKQIIQFPFPTVLGAKLLKLIPNRVFDILAQNIKQ